MKMIKNVQVVYPGSGRGKLLNFSHSWLRDTQKEDQFFVYPLDIEAFHRNSIEQRDLWILESLFQQVQKYYANFRNLHHQEYSLEQSHAVLVLEFLERWITEMKSTPQRFLLLWNKSILKYKNTLAYHSKQEKKRNWDDSFQQVKIVLEWILQQYYKYIDSLSLDVQPGKNLVSRLQLTISHPIILVVQHIVALDIPRLTQFPIQGMIHFQALSSHISIIARSMKIPALAVAPEFEDLIQKSQQHEAEIYAMKENPYLSIENISSF